jgi:hypothetical protein
MQSAGRFERVVGVIAFAAVVAACGDEDPASSLAATAPAPGNNAPVISGTLDPIAYEDEDYLFKPTASDPDGDPIVFGIDGKPGWAEFDTETGEFSGKPGRGDRGQHRGVIIWVTDGASTTMLPEAEIDVEPMPVSNTAPAISGTPAGNVTAGNLYDFIPTVSDADGDPLSFTIQNRPGWAQFDSQIGRLSGIPDSGDVGSYGNIVIRVSDGVATTGLAPFVIVVNPPPSLNTPPLISGQPAASVLSGNAYSFTPTASDLDGDSLSFSVAALPGWAQFSASTGTLSGTPTESDAGSYNGISISVSDGEAHASLPSFSIEVIATNSPPTISGNPDDTVPAGDSYSFVPVANDPDGDSLTFSILGRPSWANFNTATGALTGSPDNGDIGSYNNIRITVSDGSANTMLASFSIDVVLSNTAPTISGFPSNAVLVGNFYDFVPTASDADGDPLSFTIQNRPGWAQFDSQIGRLSGDPDAGDVGTYNNISISVSDGTATTNLSPFAIIVNPPPSLNTPPLISGQPAASVLSGNAYSFTPTASDLDGDSLSFSVAALPGWAQFSASTGTLSGTPTESDAGSYNGISISVSDGEAHASLPSFSIEVIATNSPPTISGNPDDTVLVGDSYSFVPVANDPDGDNLTFSISGRPVWANFDTASGTLTGAPGAGDVGTYNNISISVSDGDGSATLNDFSIGVVPAATGSATLSWIPPTQYTDGSPLTDLAGYVVYWGTGSGNYQNSTTLTNPGLTAYVVDNLLAGTTYFFATKAYNSNGLESSFSNEASKTIP